MNQQQIGKLISVIACLQPIFLLSTKGWASGILIVSALASILFSATRSVKDKEFRIMLNANEKWFAIAFLMPLIATAISAILRNDYSAAQFDSPSRFILALIIYLSLRRTDIKIDQYLMISISIGILVAFIYQISNNGFPPSPSIRAQTHFMDPIMFGYISLSFCLVTLYSSLALKTSRRWISYLCFFSGLLALYLNFLSQTRTV